ncbi:MM3350-like domain-containing protein [Xylariaceae sp. FL1019]|nr:MM3350-like domain-containing protein [Xylariaceae sp. FL1019]
MSATASAQRCGNAECTTPNDASALQKCARCQSETYCSRECQAAEWNTHKQSCRRPNYIVHLEVFPGEIKNPAVTRVLSCPSDATFYQLHLAIQTAFNWASTHSFDFGVVNPDYAPVDDMADFIALMRSRGPSGVNADPSSPQEYLFRVTDPTQYSQSYGIDRMHEGSRKHPNAPEKKANAYKLHQLFDDAKYSGKQIVYTYDFGDNWEHYLTIKGRADATRKFTCLEGTGHEIAEDVGNIRGWDDLKAAYRATNPTKEQREKRKWYESMASNGDPQGLAGARVDLFEKDRVNSLLGKISL